MKAETRKFKKLIEKSKSILIVSHSGPDMDAFCSMLLVREFLKTYFPNKKVSVRSKQSPNFNIPNMHNVEVVQNLKEGDEDLVIITDTGHLDSVCDPDDNLANTKKATVVIDHHQTLEEGTELVINEFRSSATEQVLILFKDMLGWRYKLTKDIAELGQYGIVADTGRFMYETTSADTFKIFGELFALSPINIEEVEIKSGKFPVEATNIVIDLLKNLTIVEDMAYTYIDRETIQRENYQKFEVNSAVRFLKNNYIRYIQGVHWGFLLKPVIDDPKQWQVSFRSIIGHQDVEKIAKKLGGGGHTNSSGSELHFEEEKSLEDVLKYILENIA